MPPASDQLSCVVVEPGIMRWVALQAPQASLGQVGDGLSDTIQAW